MRVPIGLGAVTALLLGGCGARDTPPLTRDPAGFPKEMRQQIACLREAGLKFEVPASVRKMAKQPAYTKKTAHSSEGRYPPILFFIVPTKPKPTKRQVEAYGDCAKSFGIRHIAAL